MLRLLIIDMTTMEDYNIIVETLKKHSGIDSIDPFTNNQILTITYFPSIVSLDTIGYVINALGYNQNSQNKNIYQYQPKKKGGWCANKDRR